MSTLPCLPSWTWDENEMMAAEAHCSFLKRQGKQLLYLFGPTREKENERIFN